jgi:aldehyde dehydrogenase (NAD+)
LLLLSLSGLSVSNALAQQECTAPPPSSEKHDFYINGSWVPPVPPQHTLQVIDPSTASPVASISLGNQADVDLAVAAARKAFESWAFETTPEQRREYIETLLEIYMKRQDEMAQLITLEMGAPIDMSRHSQVGSGTYWIQSFLEEMEDFEFERTVDGTTTILMDPIGVVALITPWNWPMNQVTLKVIPALAVGCTCILKPSELAPLSSLLLAEMIHDAGFPPGVFNLVNGDGAGVGAQLSSHPGVDMVSFTGSTRAGALVSKAAADTFKRVTLELGGKGANLIFADVGEDLEETVQQGVWGCFENSGQSCNAPTRMLVERSVYDQAVEIARTLAESIEVKSGHEQGDHLGPVISLQQYEKIQNYIRIGIEEGARLVAGGLGRPDGTNEHGFYVRPTIFSDVQPSMTVMQEEIFGPVLCIMPFDTEEEALAIANDTPYGLTNYVHSQDGARRNRLARRLRSGMVDMNGMGGDSGSPFGGMKASGNGREGGTWGLEEFCEVKAITGWANAEKSD